jgi:hypothetical protein
MKAFLLITVLLIFGLRTIAQETPTLSTSTVDIKTVVSRQFNLGLSAGLGGAHSLFVLPQITLRSNRVSLSGFSYSPFIQGKMWSLEADLEVYKFKNKVGFIDSNTYLTLSGGTTRRTVYTPYGRDATRTPFALAGLNKYLKNERSRVSLKVGLMYYWTSKNLPALPKPVSPDPWVVSTSSWSQDLEESRWLPYGEVSYQLYLFKIRDKQEFLNSSGNKVSHRDWQAEKKLTKETENTERRKIKYEESLTDSWYFDLRELVRYNFNPGISLGLGGARLKFGVPNVSMLMGNWTVSFMPGKYEGYYGRDYAMQFDLEFPWSLSKKKDVFLAASMGGSFSEKKSIIPASNLFIRKDLATFMLGVQVPMKNNRSRIAIRGGFVSIWDRHYEPFGRQPRLETERNLPYGEIAYQVYAMPFGKKQKVLRKFLTGEFKPNKYRMRELCAEWFNPYLSLGLGLNRAMGFTPAGGVKISRIRIDASGVYLPEYTLSGTVNLNFDAFKLAKSDSRVRYITAGLGAFGSSGYSSDFAVYSLTSGMIFYKLNGRSSMDFQVGLGRWYSSSYDDSPYQGDEDYIDRSSSDAGWMPTAGLSYNIYLFKFK